MQLPPPPPPSSQQLCSEKTKDFVHDPPRLTYLVQAVNPSSSMATTEHLDCTIHVKGAVGTKGETPYFKVYAKSTGSSSPSKGEATLVVHAYNVM